jgi:hypothetical protein
LQHSNPTSCAIPHPIVTDWHLKNSRPSLVPAMKPMMQFKRLRIRKEIALLGVLIRGMVVVVQTIHFHPLEQAEWHCSICLAVHATAAILALPILAVSLAFQFQIAGPGPRPQGISRSASIFIRPPPAVL